MKKSEIYKMAQYAVLNGHNCNSDKLEILRVLMAQEDIERLVEEYNETENASETV